MDVRGHILQFIVVSAAYLLYENSGNKFTKTTDQIRSDRHIPEGTQYNNVDCQCNKVVKC